MSTQEPIRLSLASGQRTLPEVEPLFRPQATQAAREALHGEVTLAMPPSAPVAAALSLVALVMLGGALFIVEVPQRTRVVGVLMPPDGFMKIVAADAGQIVEVLVSEGERVVAGQPLLSVSSDHGATARGAVSLSQLQSLQTERRLLKDADRQRRRIQLQRIDAAEHQLANIDRRLALVDTEVGIHASRRNLLVSRFDRVQRLVADGNLPAIQLDEEKLVLLQAEAASTVLQQQSAQLSEERDQLAQMHSGLAEEAHVQQIEFAIAREQLDRQISALEALVSKELRAPEDGVVARVTARAGQAVDAGSTLLTLHAVDARLQAWLYLSSADAGQLQTGQEVELRLDAYPYQMFGTQSATVTAISRIALLPSELDVPLSIAGPVFEVRARLHNQHVAARGGEWPLLAGTSFQADIVQRRYRLYEWLLRLRQNDETRAIPTDA
jgi:membrane fusion protein